MATLILIYLLAFIKLSLSNPSEYECFEEYSSSENEIEFTHNPELRSKNCSSSIAIQINPHPQKYLIGTIFSDTALVLIFHTVVYRSQMRWILHSSILQSTKEVQVGPGIGLALGCQGHFGDCKFSAEFDRQSTSEQELECPNPILIAGNTTKKVKIPGTSRDPLICPFLVIGHPNEKQQILLEANPKRELGFQPSDVIRRYGYGHYGILNDTTFTAPSGIELEFAIDNIVTCECPKVDPKLSENLTTIEFTPNQCNSNGTLTCNYTFINEDFGKTDEPTVFLYKTRGYPSSALSATVDGVSVSEMTYIHYERRIFGKKLQLFYSTRAYQPTSVLIGLVKLPKGCGCESETVGSTFSMTIQNNGTCGHFCCKETVTMPPVAPSSHYYVWGNITRENVIQSTSVIFFTNPTPSFYRVTMNLLFEKSMLVMNEFFPMHVIHCDYGHNAETKKIEILFETVTGCTCGQESYDLDENGLILTPPTHNGIYCNAMNCTYVLTAPKRHSIALNATNLFIAHDDYLIVFDGTNTSARHMARYSGWHPQIPILRSSSRKMTVKFISDYFTQKGGFSLNFKIEKNDDEDEEGGSSWIIWMLVVFILSAVVGGIVFYKRPVRPIVFVQPVNYPSDESLNDIPPSLLRRP